MTTEKQILANRANAQKSTGPTSEAGKAVSRHNALSYGLTASTLLWDAEEWDDYQQLQKDFHREFAPETRLEVEYVERLVSLAWRLHRIPEFEMALLWWLDNQNDLSHVPKRARSAIGLGQAVSQTLSGDLLAKLSRYEVHLTRQCMQTLDQLEKAKALRLARTSDYPPPITIDNAAAQPVAGQGPPETVQSEDCGPR